MNKSKAIVYVVLILLGLPLTSASQGATLVEGATVDSVSTYWFFSPAIDVEISGGTGDCALSGNVQLYQASQFPSDNPQSTPPFDGEVQRREQLNRHLALLLSAKASGRTVTIIGPSCAEGKRVKIE